MRQLPFSNRIEAGQILGKRLATELGTHHLPSSVVVLALPRGGVPVGCEVAKALQAPLDVLVVRKVGVPWHRELAMGAVTRGSAPILDKHLIAELGVSQEEVDAAVAQERAEVDRREKLYRQSLPPPNPHGRVVILVDDGLATGSTMLVAARSVRALKPAKLIIAVPVGSTDACELLAKEADTVVCLATPEPFIAVGAWYEDFRQVSDAEVRRLLEESHRQAGKGTFLGNRPQHCA